MRLEKIKDVRVGQIWSFNNGETYDIVIDVRTTDGNYNGDKYNPYEIRYQIFADRDYASDRKDMEDKNNICEIDIEYCRREEKATDYLMQMFKHPDKYLIGFLGITHEIQNDKLVEIPRKQKFEVDDILKIFNYYKDETTGNICGQFTGLICYDGLLRKLENYDKIEKVGILGVNYEFVNDKFVR